MHQGVLDVEVVWVMKYSDLLISGLCSAIACGGSVF